jgi:hypothetical protein
MELQVIHLSQPAIASTMQTYQVTFPEITQTVPLINRIVATPRVARVTDALSVSVPAM